MRFTNDFFFLKLDLFCSRRVQPQKMKTLKVTNSAIKGYHVFKIKPHPFIKMLVLPEHNNPYDQHAMIIKMPVISDIDKRYLNDITDDGEGQVVKEIAGKIVGRVPANLSAVFYKLLKENLVQEIYCVSEGRPMHSHTPYFKQSFVKRGKWGKDRRGGGATIPCRFEIICHDSSLEKAKETLIKLIKELTKDATEKVLDENDETATSSCPW